MKSITITINTENAAFDLEPLYEVSRILERLTIKFDEKEIPDVLMDINGNKVGTVEVSE